MKNCFFFVGLLNKNEVVCRTYALIPIIFYLWANSKREKFCGNVKIPITDFFIRFILKTEILRTAGSVEQMQLHGISIEKVFKPYNHVMVLLSGRKRIYIPD